MKKLFVLVLGRLVVGATVLCEKGELSSESWKSE